MKIFLTRITLFFTPIVLISVPSFFYLKGLGELVPLSSAVQENQEKGHLIGYAYSDPGYLIKHQALKIRAPEVIALGTSRALQFRSLYFKDPESFYNCGRSVSKIRDFRSFLEAYPTSPPKIIILCLDQDFFNHNYDDLFLKGRIFSVTDPSKSARYSKSFKGLFKAARKGDFEFRNIEESSGIGGTSKWFKEGFRKDGSYQYGKILSEKADYKFGMSLDRIVQNKGRFVSSDRINSAAVEELEAFLEDCKLRDIHVVGFLPPYAPTVFSEFKKVPKLYSHILELQSVIEPVFAARGLSVFDFGEIESYGSNDFETIDGFHASEVCYLRMMKLMGAGDEMLAAYLDQKELNLLFENSHSSRQFFPIIKEESIRPVSSDLR
ncbi:hypothetical protein N9170_02975 [Akkermansiaceae bacterium]|nr:hypothetical protein [Akkermansiaceae bacterium]